MPLRFTGNTRSDFPAGAIKTAADHQLFENQTRANEGAEHDAQWGVNIIISADGRTFEVASTEVGSDDGAFSRANHPWKVTLTSDGIEVAPGLLSGNFAPVPDLVRRTGGTSYIIIFAEIDGDGELDVDTIEITQEDEYDPEDGHLLAVIDWSTDTVHQVALLNLQFEYSGFSEKAFIFPA